MLGPVVTCVTGSFPTLPKWTLGRGRHVRGNADGPGGRHPTRAVGGLRNAQRERESVMR